ncbi:MAG TPA: hypothetical protein VMU34_00690 [Mycobacterium sp.]|nr:hypothetical protein [Mycobacterium sp.]
MQPLRQGKVDTCALADRTTLRCHNRLLDSPATCRGCGQFRVLVARSDDGAELCGPCAGIGLDPRCASCDRPGRHYSRGRCAHCTLEVVLRDLLSGSDGEVPAQLEPVYRTLTGAVNPRGLIRWSAKSPNARLLAQLAASGEPLTHELLDRLPPGRHEFYVRQLLVTTGVLPERHDDLERLPSWLDTILAPAPAEHARLVRPFTHWFLLRRARRRAAVRRQPALAGSYLRTRITTVLALLSWLDEQNLALRQLDQPILDSWLAAGNASSYTIRYFLAWAHSRGLASKLVAPVQPRQDPERILDEQQRWDLLRGCLTDDTMTVDLRAVAALVLLFGLPVLPHPSPHRRPARDRRRPQLPAHGGTPAPAASEARSSAAAARRNTTHPITIRDKSTLGAVAVPRPDPGTTAQPIQHPGQAAHARHRRPTGPQCRAHGLGRRPAGPGPRRRARPVDRHRREVVDPRQTGLGRLRRRARHHQPGHRRGGGIGHLGIGSLRR